MKELPLAPEVPAARPKPVLPKQHSGKGMAPSCERTGKRDCKRSTMERKKTVPAKTGETADAAFHRLSPLPECARTLPVLLLSSRGAGKLVIAVERNVIGKEAHVIAAGGVSHLGETGLGFHACAGVQASCKHNIQRFWRGAARLVWEGGRWSVERLTLRNAGCRAGLGVRENRGVCLHPAAVIKETPLHSLPQSPLSPLPQEVIGLVGAVLF